MPPKRERPETPLSSRNTATFRQQDSSCAPPAVKKSTGDVQRFELASKIRAEKKLAVIPCNLCTLRETECRVGSISNACANCVELGRFTSCDVKAKTAKNLDSSNFHQGPQSSPVTGHFVTSNGSLINDGKQIIMFERKNSTHQMSIASSLSPEGASLSKIEARLTSMDASLKEMKGSLQTIEARQERTIAGARWLARNGMFDKIIDVDDPPPPILQIGI